MGRCVRDWLLHWAATRPDVDAVIDGEQRWTYAELGSASGRMAVSLAAAGVGEGSRVATLVGDGAPAVATLHAVRRLRAIVVPLNRRAAPAELALQLTAARAAVLVHDRDRAVLARTSLAGAAAVRALEVGPLLAGPAHAAGAGVLHDQVDLDAPATILFTSGTSRRPKGAVLSHGSQLASAEAWASFLRPLPTDRWLACVPLFHVAGLAIVIRAGCWGIPLEVHRRFDARAVRDALDDGVSHLSLVGPMLDRLLDLGAGAPVPRTLRAVLLGGGPIPPANVRRASARGYPVVATYGLTEAGSGVTALPADADDVRRATVGPALPGVELRILAEGRPAAVGEVGEIVVRGPMVFAGYDQLPADTARALRAGWLRTGDFGVLDGRGDLSVVDRRDDLIVSGGENVYPSEVEAALCSHPAVAEAATVGRVSRDWGSVPVAAIVLEPGADVGDGELERHCRERLAGYKVPVAFVRLASLPRGPSGKLRRAAIREQVREPGA